ncbi:ABC transporter related [Beutenbergia cavernae DSM 12333]|uniref:ABC transporter related n=1 Tax=Beutenbergia cavernae (strain ATCC BAA-8 / DSM 12333 / CCUG 43141 / JCM 11478 / NBRC 16432 / NCIMB 13614 / HKI 0122) TaxID=471853 RepID=C5BXS1_BEUC1|nr:ABC transporter ATP-binding protein [Beutenbergia cavernae]ACQ78815.1 ABC transporter related [Beutenbergia cavernae DSM 12333]
MTVTDVRQHGDGAALFADHVARRFGSVRAVADASIRVHPGQVTALVGPNGSGKTTLLLMLAGLLAPDAGVVRVAGLDPAHDGARARRLLGWMPDVFGTWDSLTAREVLTTVAAAYRISAPEAASRADELLAVVHLTEYADVPAHVLSRGQKQRLGLARALVHRPRALLLDEPASGLDPRSRVDLRHLVRELAAAGTAVLISSHVLAELDELVDDAVFLDRGVTSSTNVAPTQGTTRWRLRTLDGAALAAWAASVGLPLAVDADARPPVDGGADAIVTLPDERAAAALLRDAVAAGVPVSSLAPAGGALEQAYLSLEAERR